MDKLSSLQALCLSLVSNKPLTFVPQLSNCFFPTRDVLLTWYPSVTGCLGRRFCSFAFIFVHRLFCINFRFHHADHFNITHSPATSSRARAWFACDPLSWTSLYCTRLVWYRLRFFTVRLLHFYFYSMGLVGAKNFPWPFPWFIAVVTALCAFRPLAGLPPGRKYSTINLYMISFASI